MDSMGLLLCSSDSAGTSLDKLSGLNASSGSNSFNEGSSVSGSSLPGHSSGDSSGSNASGSSGSYLQTWQWLVLLGFICCCKGAIIGAIMGKKGKGEEYEDEEEEEYDEERGVD